LSIVREVVEQAGGYIHVRSRTGEGSTFTVCFPVNVEAEAPAIRDTRASAVVVESSAARPAT
jgi:K+-sensing histidine kinase KdpD